VTAGGAGHDHLERLAGRADVAREARPVVAAARTAGCVGRVPFGALLIHDFAFCLATGRAFGAAETTRSMWKRTLLALALTLAVGACRVPALAAPSIAGVGDVRVLAVRFVPGAAAGPGLAAGGLTYVLTDVELTNDTPHDFTPEVSRFFLTGAQNRRYQGTDRGSSVFVGVSNSRRRLKQGDTRRYTVGFRTTDPVIAGTVSYEP
jgi:hypothetical protein